MGKIKNPNEVDEKNFSDSIELFDSLFQEELEIGTNKQDPPKRTTVQQRPPSDKIPDEENEIVSGIPGEEQPDGLESIVQVKKSTPSTKTSDRKEKGIGPKMKQPVPEQKSVSDKKAPSGGKRDTLKMRNKGAHPTLEPEQTDDETIQESGIGPIGSIKLGKEGGEDPLPASASPEKVGKLYTPKESKSLIPKISIKESNLYKVVLSGFAGAIIVMVLINFFGLIGSKEPQEPSKLNNKGAVQDASSKKRSDEIAKKPKKSATVQKKSPKPVLLPRLNKIDRKPSIIKPSPRKRAAVPSSQPQPKTVLPETAKKKQGVQASPSTQQPSTQTNRIAKRPTSQKLPPQQALANPIVSTGTSTTVIEKARKEPDVRKSPPGTQVTTPPKTKKMQTLSPPPSPPKSQKTAITTSVASRGKAPSYPYSVYLGAFKTLERAKVAVSQYQEKGVSSYWVKVDLGRKGTWHRLYTGHFRDGETALDFINKRDLNEASVKKTRYTTLIGVYSSKDAIKKKSLVLNKLGYSSYVVDGGNGTSQLYSGAFITKGGAEKQYQELVAKGIRSRVVER